MDISGKTVLITGGSRRVGRAIALGLAGKGARVAVHYRRSKPGADRTVAEALNLGAERAAAFRADLEDVGQIKKLIRSVAAHFGGLDILINNASMYQPGDIKTATVENWDGHLNANLRAPFFLCRQAVPYMKKSGRGHIINIADWAALRPYADFIPYCVSKAGLLCLNTVLAKALAPDIQVNAILPGPVLLPEGSSEKFRRAVIRATPMKRLGSPQNIADAVLYLLSDDFVTGAQIPVDGGRLIA